AIAFVAEEIRSLISDITGVNDQAREGGSVWSDLGQALGFVAGLLGAAVADAIGVVALALQTVVAIVRGVMPGVRALGTWLGETAAKIYLFFAEDIPNAAKSVSDAVRSILHPVGAAFDGMVDGIRSALDHLLAFVGRVVAKIPERFRPAFLDSIIEA